MKTRVNISVDIETAEKMKELAQMMHKNVSQWVNDKVWEAAKNEELERARLNQLQKGWKSSRVGKSERFRFIANEIDVSLLQSKLTPYAKEMIEQMELADRENNFPVYAQVSDDFEVYTKQLAYDDVLTDEEWHLLCAKYAVPAN